MASRRKYRKQWLRWHSQYEKFAYRNLQRTFHAWSHAIPFDSLTEENYAKKINTAINDKLIVKSYKDIYVGVGTIHGKRVGKAINKELKAFTVDEFTTEFEKNIARYLRLDPAIINRIVSVRSGYFDTITGMIANQISDGKPMREIARDIEALVNRRDFYRWQAERIARTETTAAANYAATQSGEVSGFVMQKEWISALDSRTRDDHRATNGKRVGENEAFIVRGEKLMYPGDPSGSAGNVINCRCTVALVPKRDENGNLISVN